MCDTLVSITDDGLLFAKNSDREANESQLIRWHPAADHRAGSEVNCTWITIPQMPHSHAIVVSQPWWMWGAEMGTNSHGVTIGNEAVYTTEPYGDKALLGMDLLRLALERATTAHEAVEVMVGLLERYGQGGPCSATRDGYSYHNGFLVADADGAVVLETAGRHWAVETVTGRGRSISNGLTIPGFADRYADIRRNADVACDVRRRRTEASAIGARGVADMFAALRDHGNAGPTEDHIEWSADNGSLAGPCAHAGGTVTATQTTSSWVADLRGDPLHWVTATAAPCTSIFKPIRVGCPLDLGPEPDDRFDGSTRWWSHELLHRTALRDHERAMHVIAAERDSIEASWLHEVPESVQAFERADQLEAAWLDRLVAIEPDDTRPPQLQRLWERYDTEAGVPTAASATHHG